MVLGALFYPPTCIMLGTYTALIVIFRAIREKAIPKGTAILVLLGATGAILATSKFSSEKVTGPVAYPVELRSFLPAFSRVQAGLRPPREAARAGSALFATRDVDHPLRSSNRSANPL